MKHTLLLATFAMLFLFVSCDKNELTYPTLTVVNSTKYTSKVYCDNILQVVCDPNTNDKVDLSCSINIPVYVEVKFYDSSNSLVTKYTYDSYTFTWDKKYKMILTYDTETSKLIQY